MKKTDIATQQFFEYFTGFHLDKNILIINTIKSKFSKCRKLCRYEFKIEIFNNNVVNTLTFRIVFCIDGNLLGTNLFLDQSNSVRSVLNSLNLKRSFEFFDIKDVKSVKILVFFWENLSSWYPSQIDQLPNTKCTLISNFNVIFRHEMINPSTKHPPNKY